MSDRADHPHVDPGDGRQECQTCGKWIWPVIHSCGGLPVTSAARLRAGTARPVRTTMSTKDPRTRLCQFADDTTQPGVLRAEAKVAAYVGDLNPTGLTDPELAEALRRRIDARGKNRPGDGGDDLPVLRERASELRAAREAGR